MSKEIVYEPPISPSGYTRWIAPVKRGYILECCNCGLLHSFDFRISNGHIQFRAKRLPKAVKR